MKIDVDGFEVPVLEGARKTLTNNDPVRDFLLKDGEDYRIFCGENARHRIPWGNEGKVMCPRYHIKKYCFKDYKNKSSHVAVNKIPAEKKRAFQQYLKKCRGN